MIVIAKSNTQLTPRRGSLSWANLMLLKKVLQNKKQNKYREK
jgi:hypothetical protein